VGGTDMEQGVLGSKIESRGVPIASIAGLQTIEPAPAPVQESRASLTETFLDRPARSAQLDR
jgi:hypothetical protein